MRITLGVTDNAWADYLRTDERIYEANFWVPSGRNFMGRARPDEPFLFKTKSPVNRLVGGGYFVKFWELRVSEAWACFGEGNGCASEAELAAAIQKYRDRAGKPRQPDPPIGCIILRNLFFAPPGGELSEPEHWGRSIVQGKTYDPDDPDYDYVDYAFRSFQGGARIDWQWDRDLVGIDLDQAADRFGRPVLTRPRLGQGAFRLSVLEAYGNTCAITGNRMSPVLEAAHIRPYSGGGRHVVPNGIALRSDVHRLFDRGYLGVDADYRLRVSPRLKSDFGNGLEFYDREERGEVIAMPPRRDDHPDREALAWHLEKVFRAS